MTVIAIDPFVGVAAKAAVAHGDVATWRMEARGCQIRGCDGYGRAAGTGHEPRVGGRRGRPALRGVAVLRQFLMRRPSL
jgi:hypothetical protein